MEAASNNDMVAATIVFALASFVASFGYSVTGFGMAILFWFVFTIGDIAGFMECSLCGVKEAAFFQAISLASVTPLLLWQSRRSIRNHANKLLLTAFIPATLIGTPVGQLLQKTARAEVVRLIVGIFILLISAFESFRLIKGRGTTGRNESSTNDKHEEHIDSKVDLEKASIPNTDSNDEENSSNNPSSTESFHDEESDGQATSASTATPSAKEDEEDGFKPDHASGSKFWLLGFALGFVSGFLGGLVGIRSGPILIFFLHFNYPKPIIRSNIMIISCVNTYVRIIYYIIEHFTESNSVEWFDLSIWYVYVCVIIAGLLGVPLGSWVEPKINQAQYNAIIVIALIIAGLMGVINGSIDISQIK